MAVPRKKNASRDTVRAAADYVNSTLHPWFLRLLRWYYAPQFLHLERVRPTQPALLVGNHSVFNIFDAMLLTDRLQQHHGIRLRPLGDRAHFRIPVWRELIEAQGGVLGSRENCEKLMRHGAHILVFPGGAREVFKRRGEAYKLIWKQRFGFVELAVRHGYPILPYATVGAEESVDILLDAGDYMRTPLGRYLKQSGIADRYLRSGEELPPIIRGIGLTPIPRPEAMYFVMGKPIDTRQYRNRHKDPTTLQRIRDRVARQLQALIREGQELRQQTGRGNGVRWLVNRL
jgi:1-acyl-sn-glycerol-3-phosphate acyltransferase